MDINVKRTEQVIELLHKEYGAIVDLSEVDILSVENGKYTLVCGSIKCLEQEGVKASYTAKAEYIWRCYRYGEPWVDKMYNVECNSVLLAAFHALIGKEKE